jgi:non-lysosomal glucosylceramidase
MVSRLNFCKEDWGKYRKAIQSDALFGQYLADLAGLRENSDDMLPLSQIRSHLLAVYAYNFRGCKNGRVGPLLVSNPFLQNYTRDGGEDLQLGEVIVGSAWAYAAMLDYYGLTREAEEVEAALVRTLYERSGLQFRTPAAWDGEGRFRAPLNMRPLASWFLHLNKIAGRRQSSG